MSTSYYDVIVLGTDPAPLTCAALLSKRGFRVLVLGQQEGEPTYKVGDTVLPRRPLDFVSASSPIMRRLMSELGLSQRMRRVTHTSEPALQLCMPGHRLDVTRDANRLTQEIGREFPKVKRLVEDFHSTVNRLAKASDPLLEEDLVWPPDTFMERREFARAAAKLPFDKDGGAAHLLDEYPDDHPFRAAVQACVRFGGGMWTEHPSALAISRLYANFHQRAATLQGDQATWLELLSERIRTHSGEVRLQERAAEVLVRRSTAVGVRLFGSDEEVGAGFVICGTDVANLLRMLPDRAQFEELFERLGEPQLRSYRYTLNLVMETAGVPVGMHDQVLHLRNVADPDSPQAVTRVRRRSLNDAHELLSLEALLPSRQVEEVDGYLAGARERLLPGLRELVPFLDEHLVMMDSPHDGLEPFIGKRGSPCAPLGKRGGARSMAKLYSYAVTSTLGLCALPVRSPVHQLLLCNDQVVPGLGIEGSMLAAASAARVVSRSDRSKEWMRRGLWTKVEI